MNPPRRRPRGSEPDTGPYEFALHVLLDQSTRDALLALQDARGGTLSDIVRELINREHDAMGGKRS